MRLPVPEKLRLPVLLAAATAIYGLSILICGSAAEAVYLASVPGFLAWRLLYRSRRPGVLSIRHAAYFGLITAMVAAYLVAYARVTPSVKVRWQEVAVAVYFLLGLHVILWCMDAAVRGTLCRLLGTAGANPARWRGLTQGASRGRADPGRRAAGGLGPGDALGEVR